MENIAEEEENNWIFQPDFILTILIPSLLLFILLLVTIVTACILHSRQKKRKIQNQFFEIFHSRSPVIFASEPGRYNDKDMLSKRLFSDDENEDCLPDYEDRVDIKEKTCLKKDPLNIVNLPQQSARTLPRQVPPYRNYVTIYKIEIC